MRLLPLALLLTACSGAETDTGVEAPDPWVEPDAGGWHDVATRVDSVSARGGETLVLQLWYPATETGEGTRYDGMVEGNASDIGAPACDTARPVIGFSHGNGGLRYQSIFFTEYAASRGFVVFAPDHVGNTAFDLGEVSTAEMAVRRPADMADAFDHLLARSADAADPLFGCVDADAGYAMVGHSFGGYTTFATAAAPLDLEGMAERCPDLGWLCGSHEVYEAANPGGDGQIGDERVWAGVPWAPAGRFAIKAEAINVPFLVIGGEDDITTPWSTTVQPMFEALTVTPRYLAGLDRVGHFSFSDFCIDPDDGCGNDFLPLDETHDLINGLTMGFLEAQNGESRAADWLPPEHEALSWTAQE